MTNLISYKENFTNGMHINYLTILTVSAVLAGILVITIKNPIVSVLYLIGLFLSIAIYLMSLGVNFIGLAYLLVYVGAVSILFLFILMLINIRISEIGTYTSNNIPLAVIIGTCFFYTVVQASPSIMSSKKAYINIYSDKNKYSEFFNISPLNFKTKALNNNDNENLTFFNASVNNGKYENIMLNNPLDYNYTLSNDLLYSNNPDIVISQGWSNNIIDYSHIITLGNVIYTNYPIWLLITSLILLLAMVGTIVITIKTRN